MDHKVPSSSETISSVSVKALKDETERGTSSFPGRRWDPGLEIQVPFDQRPEPLRFVLAARTGTLLLVSLIVLRIYLGWSYAGDRLLSAVIPHEESGWYHGQTRVKPPEVLARDRLLGSCKVMAEDDLAAAAAKAAFGRPVHCRDRYYRALAGGQYSKWEDHVK
ncbi:hypothetical protein GH714_033055 [Hevea brasiliensis]|uniref:Uncharacterized protein n=1 Tax=Hevea brasiliensis TaxID=3981 RepID=A0A6A6L3G8_HEVBR|nr:hypothetical protein GH714_033055 [Hevea brasiliensis]